MKHYYIPGENAAYEEGWKDAINVVLDIIDDVYHEWSNNNIDTAGEALSMVRNKVMEPEGGAE